MALASEQLAEDRLVSVEEQRKLSLSREFGGGRPHQPYGGSPSAVCY